MIANLQSIFSKKPHTHTLKLLNRTGYCETWWAEDNNAEGYISSFRVMFHKVRETILYCKRCKEKADPIYEVYGNVQGLTMPSEDMDELEDKGILLYG